MVTTLFRRFADHGLRRAIVWVLDTNTPAIEFYKRLGAVEVEGAIKVVGKEGESEMVLREVAYGWADIGAVIAK